MSPEALFPDDSNLCHVDMDMPAQHLQISIPGKMKDHRECLEEPVVEQNGGGNYNLIR